MIIPSRLKCRFCPHYTIVGALVSQARLFVRVFFAVPPSERTPCSRHSGAEPPPSALHSPALSALHVRQFRGTFRLRCVSESTFRGNERHTGFRKGFPECGAHSECVLPGPQKYISAKRSSFVPQRRCAQMKGNDGVRVRVTELKYVVL